MTALTDYITADTPEEADAALSSLPGSKTEKLVRAVAQWGESNEANRNSLQRIVDSLRGFSDTPPWYNVYEACNAYPKMTRQNRDGLAMALASMEYAHHNTWRAIQSEEAARYSNALRLIHVVTCVVMWTALVEYVKPEDN